MNYEAARQRESNGRWNWTNMRDGRIWTLLPCGYGALGTTCDHETKEQAERHHYDHELAGVRFEQLDPDRRLIHRCDVESCRELETQHAVWPDGYTFDSVCDAHANSETVAGLHPFEPGIEVIHS